MPKDLRGAGGQIQSVLRMPKSYAKHKTRTSEIKK